MKIKIIYAHPIDSGRTNQLNLPGNKKRDVPDKSNRRRNNINHGVSN